MFKFSPKATVLFAEGRRADVLNKSQAAALRAPANRSALRGADFKVMHCIGRNAWNNGYVHSPDPADHDAEAAYRWAQAMQQMQSFYQQATKRKGVVF